ncbi:proline-rich protein 36-like [Oreochromis niloticus]|uniref:proline-rich protein 36-like n=1 Tax=Oreochromis niloticus TaxID=8128 RepID=UPI0009049269|nr:proline-rich protein 36-like [Oreochromis niloticus]XP_025754538.1 proline-rich protein 36-like [Oreochromis niloticus]
MNKKMKAVSPALASNAKPAESGEREVLANLSPVGFSGSVGLETVSSVAVSSLSVGPVVTNCEPVVSNRDILSLPVETVTIHAREECCSGSDGNCFSCAHFEPGDFKLEPINTKAVDFQTVCVADNWTALKLGTHPGVYSEGEHGSGTAPGPLESLQPEFPTLPPLTLAGRSSELIQQTVDSVAVLVDFEIAHPELGHSNLGNSEVWPEHSEPPAQHETQQLAQSATHPPAQLHPQTSLQSVAQFPVLPRAQSPVQSVPSSVQLLAPPTVAQPAAQPVAKQSAVTTPPSLHLPIAAASLPNLPPVAGTLPTSPPPAAAISPSSPSTQPPAAAALPEGPALPDQEVSAPKGPARPRLAQPARRKPSTVLRRCPSELLHGRPLELLHHNQTCGRLPDLQHRRCQVHGCPPQPFCRPGSVVSHRSYFEGAIRSLAAHQSGHIASTRAVAVLPLLPSIGSATKTVLSLPPGPQLAVMRPSRGSRLVLWTG